MINYDCNHTANTTTATINCCNLLEPVTEVTQTFQRNYNPKQQQDDYNNNNKKLMRLIKVVVDWWCQNENAIITFNGNNRENTATTTGDALELERLK